MIIPDTEILKSFEASIALNLRIFREKYGVQSIEIQPDKGTPLYLLNDKKEPVKLSINCDSCMAESVLVKKMWDIIDIQFLMMCGEKLKELNLIDIGANQGLFTRQALTLVPSIKLVNAYEPHPYNFEIFGRNLSGIERVKKNNFALSNKSGELVFYIDPNNCGNYSLNIAAMPENYEKISVPVVDVNSEAQKWVANEMPIFYKSDTQGLDESIITTIDFEFFKNVTGGNIEIWNIEKPEYDKDKLAKILGAFDHIISLGKPEEHLNVLSVMNFIENGPKKKFTDICFWND